MAAKRGGSNEIAVLKTAETEAQQVVNAAREERKIKMRQAQSDARKEVEDYRAMREAKLRSVQPEAQALEEKVRRITQDTNAKIAMLETEYQRNKDVVIGMLLQVSLNIDNPFADGK